MMREEQAAPLMTSWSGKQTRVIRRTSTRKKSVRVLFSTCQQTLGHAHQSSTPHKV